MSLVIINVRYARLSCTHSWNMSKCVRGMCFGMFYRTHLARRFNQQVVVRYTSAGIMLAGCSNTRIIYDYARVGNGPYIICGTDGRSRKMICSKTRIVTLSRRTRWYARGFLVNNNLEYYNSLTFESYKEVWRKSLGTSTLNTIRVIFVFDKQTVFGNTFFRYGGLPVVRRSGDARVSADWRGKTDIADRQFGPFGVHSRELTN